MLESFHFLVNHLEGNLGQKPVLPAPLLPRPLGRQLRKAMATTATRWCWLWGEHPLLSLVCVSIHSTFDCHSGRLTISSPSACFANKKKCYFCCNSALWMVGYLLPSRNLRYSACATFKILILLLLDSFISSFTRSQIAGLYKQWFSDCGSFANWAFFSQLFY